MALDHIAAGRRVEALVDMGNGLVGRDVFHDEEIYELELRNIFARCWQFVAHECMIPNAGDFVASYIGEDPVIVCRQEDGSVAVWLNTCRHRGMRICKADRGNSGAFMCSYHGWTYDRKGGLLSIPFGEEYGDHLDKERGGAMVAPQVDSYRGLIFATFDPSAPPLRTYIGDMAYYLDALVARRDGGTELVGGIHKTIVHANWKYGAENFVQDGHHAFVTHASAIMAQRGPDSPPMSELPDVMLYGTDGGHGGVCFTSNTFENGDMSDLTVYLRDTVRPESRRLLGDARDRLHNVAANTLFPNLSWLTSINTFRVWLPRGPHKMELWSFALVDSAATDEEKAMIRKNVVRTFTTSGIFEQDDTENWTMCQDTARGYLSRNLDHNVQMGMGKEQADEDYPGTVSYGMGELPGRNFYKRWYEMMTQHGTEAWESGRRYEAAGTQS